MLLLQLLIEKKHYFCVHRKKNFNYILELAYISGAKEKKDVLRSTFTILMIWIEFWKS